MATTMSDASFWAGFNSVKSPTTTATTPTVSTAVTSKPVTATPTTPAPSSNSGMANYSSPNTLSNHPALSNTQFSNMLTGAQSGYATAEKNNDIAGMLGYATMGDNLRGQMGQAPQNTALIQRLKTQLTSNTKPSNTLSNNPNLSSTNPSNNMTFKDFASQNGIPYSYDDKTNTLSIQNANGTMQPLPTGDTSGLGIILDKNGNHVITNPTQFNNYLGYNSQQQYMNNNQNATTQSIKNAQNLSNTLANLAPPDVTSLYNNRQTAQTQAIQNYYDKLVGGYNTQLANDIYNYQNLRNQASNQNATDTLSMNENLARMGLTNSGQNITQNTQLAATLGQNLNNINVQQQQEANTIANNIANARLQQGIDTSNLYASNDQALANNIMQGFGQQSTNLNNAGNLSNSIAGTTGYQVPEGQGRYNYYTANANQTSTLTPGQVISQSLANQQTQINIQDAMTKLQYEAPTLAAQLQDDINKVALSGKQVDYQQLQNDAAQIQNSNLDVKAKADIQNTIADIIAKKAQAGEYGAMANYYNSYAADRLAQGNYYNARAENPNTKASPYFSSTNTTVKNLINSLEKDPTVVVKDNNRNVIKDYIRTPGSVQYNQIASTIANANITDAEKKQLLDMYNIPY